MGLPNPDRLLDAVPLLWAGLLDDDACLDLLWRHRFSPDGQTATCPRCEARRRFHRAKTRASYRCDCCGHHIHPTSGTILHGSSTPLRLWFRAILLIAESDGAVTAAQLERELGVSYKTASRMSRQVRGVLHGERNGDHFAVLLAQAAPLPPGPVITTVAGNGEAGYSGDGGPATEARLCNPDGVVVDDGGNLYIADRDNHVVRKVDTDGIIWTVAGCGRPGYSGDGGPATAAELRRPNGVAVDAAGNLLVADTFNHVLRKVDAATGVITTIAGTGAAGCSGDGGPAAQAMLNSPVQVLVEHESLLVSDCRNNRIRRIDASGRIDTIAGRVPPPKGIRTSGDGGRAVMAGLPAPTGLAVDEAGNIFVTQVDGLLGNHRVRRIDTSGTITTFAGTGVAGFHGDHSAAASAGLHKPYDVAVAADGRVFISDFWNHAVRTVDADECIVTVAGRGWPGRGGDGHLAVHAELFCPGGLAVGPSGALFVAERSGQRVRRVGALVG